jgi:hypothetical protein
MDVGGGRGGDPGQAVTAVWSWTASRRLQAMEAGHGYRVPLRSAVFEATQWGLGRCRSVLAPSLSSDYEEVEGGNRAFARFTLLRYGLPWT